MRERSRSPRNLERSHNGEKLALTRTQAAVTLGKLLNDRTAPHIADPLLHHDADANQPRRLVMRCIYGESVDVLRHRERAASPKRHIQAPLGS